MPLSPRLADSREPAISLTSGQLAARDRVLAHLESGRYALEDVACFCGTGAESLEIAERDRYGLPVRTVLCSGCGLLRSSPRLSPEATARFYQEDYRPLYSGHLGAERLFAEQIVRGESYRVLLEKLLPEVSIIYEVGCGAGGLLLPFADAGKTVAGCDMGGEYLELGKARGLELVHGDAAALLSARGGQRADLLFLIHAFEHFGDLHAELEGVLDVLAPGGVLFVEVPGVRPIADSAAYRGDLLRYLQNAHNYHFTARTLSFVLRSIGLDVQHADETAVAICVRPQTLTRQVVAPPRGEARSILRLLAELERTIAAGSSA